ncbi:MAG: hypothetical protein KAQ62_04320 [Cyclobacteriaceae bacterium]|nr:hypothetical protein [Cyclobacteriaceae bacterium]MCK5467947.1 hypothetical protein [Cyclobacteriaceae bacterium]
MRKSISLLLVLITFACGPIKKSDEQAFLDSLDNLTLDAPMISDEVIADIIQQVPSPLEISYLLKDAGTQYDFNLLNTPTNVSNYNSNFDKALNLGIYGTDLGYANIYEENQDAILYLNSIKGLANDLSIGQFFDFGTIARLASNSKNLDSLLLITTQNFNNINGYLQENQRSNLSVLILTGGWLEALHITCQVAEKNDDNEKLIEKIGEQKIILDNIKLMLGFYTNDPYIADLHKRILNLEKAFAQIEIIYTYVEPTMEEVNGILVVNDNSTTTINITKENVGMIRKEVISIREKIIS